MSEKNKHVPSQAIENKARKPLQKTIVIGALGLSALGFVDFANHVPHFDPNSQSKVLEHKYVPPVIEDHGYGKFPIYVKAPAKYELEVDQYQPDKFTADSDGNVAFEIQVNKETYAHTQDGQQVNHIDAIPSK